MKKRKVLFILFPLFLGVAIYLLYRSRNLFYFKMFKSHPVIYENVIQLRDYAWLFRKHFPLWFVYSLPDGLWLFSFGITLLMDRIFYNFHFFTFTIIYIFMIALEFVQKIFGGHGTKIGTFDKYDIIFFTIGYILSVMVSNYFHKREKVEKEEINLINKRREFFENIKIIFIFTILGILPSLF